MGHKQYTDNRPKRIQVNILIAPEDEETLFAVFPHAASRANAIELALEEWHKTAKIEQRFNLPWIGNPGIPVKQIFKDYEAAAIGTKDAILDDWCETLLESPYYRRVSKTWIHRQMIELRRKQS